MLVTLDPNSTATPTPFQPGPPMDSAIATETAFLTETPSPTATFTAEPPTRPPQTRSRPLRTLGPTQPAQVGARTQYTLTVTLDYANKMVAVNESIRYANTTGQTLTDVVLAVEPNLWTNCFYARQPRPGWKGDYELHA